MRVCTGCQKPKEESEFATKYGKPQPRCLACHATYARNWHRNKAIAAYRASIATWEETQLMNEAEWLNTKLAEIRKEAEARA